MNTARSSRFKPKHQRLVLALIALAVLIAAGVAGFIKAGFIDKFIYPQQHIAARNPCAVLEFFAC